jgi:hypothetical protein
MISYQFAQSHALNGKINLTKFNIELTLSSISAKKVFIFNNMIFVDVEQELTDFQQTELLQILQLHDGAEADVSPKKKELRSDIIDTMVQQSMYHPAIDNETMADYLASIDDEINCFIRSGLVGVLERKVTTDKEISIFKDFLIMPVNSDGVPFWVYLLAGVGSQMFNS